MFYDFQCKKCGKIYEEMTKYDETGKYKDVKCPNCKSKSKIKLTTACDFNFAQPEGTSKWISESQGHDYRFRHKLPKVIAEKEAAERKSHMGSGNEIYRNIDDLNKDSSWGEVK